MNINTPLSSCHKPEYFPPPSAHDDSSLKKTPFKISPIYTFFTSYSKKTPQCPPCLTSSLDKKTSAAIKIQRAWRRHHALIDLLKDAERVQALPHHAIEYLSKKISTIPTIKLNNPAFHDHLIKALATAKSARSSQAIKDYIPVFTSFGDATNGKLPQYSLTGIDKLKNHSLYEGSYLTSPLHKKIQELKSRDITREELDAIVSKFAKVHLFPWKYAVDGCYARAQLMIDMLTLSGVPRSSLNKFYAVGNLRIVDFFNKTIIWRYHVAPLVKLSDGTQRIIDPSLEPTKSLSQEEWVKKQNSLYNPKNDLGLRTESNFPYSSDCVSYVSAPELQFMDVTSHSIYQSTVSLNTRHSYAQTLADYRKDVEKEFLRPKINKYNP